MSVILEFTIDGPPVSQQPRRELYRAGILIAQRGGETMAVEVKRRRSNHADITGRPLADYAATVRAQPGRRFDAVVLTGDHELAMPNELNAWPTEKTA